MLQEGDFLLREDGFSDKILTNGNFCGKMLRNIQLYRQICRKTKTQNYGSKDTVSMTARLHFF